LKIANKKLLLTFIAAFLVILIVAYFTRYSYITAYSCIYKIDNLTNKTYLSCGGEPWEPITHMPSAKEFLESKELSDEELEAKILSKIKNN
jgi:hypothetical protein